MSDLMLLGILRMPLPDDPAQLDPLTWVQFRSTAHQAAARIEADADTIERLTAERDAARARYQWLLDQAEEVRDGWALDLFFDGAPSLETLDDVIAAAIRASEGQA